MPGAGRRDGCGVMYGDFTELIKKAKTFEPKTISVAAAEDADVLEAVRLAHESGLAKAILVGDAKKIGPLAKAAGLEGNAAIVDEPNEGAAALKAVELVRGGRAQVLMKGLVNTSDFLKAVLHPEKGLRTGRLLSHLAAYEIPGERKLVFHADTGMVVAPNLEEKKQILVNSLLALAALGILNPKVAILAANEKVHPKMQATVDAAALVEMNGRGEFPPMIAEGPIAMDVALDPEAARHKGIASGISGDVDLFLVPNIEAGNIAGKALVHYLKTKMAGVVLGATHPIVLTSRAESGEGKLRSIALACILAESLGAGRKEGKA